MSAPAGEDPQLESVGYGALFDSGVVIAPGQQWSVEAENGVRCYTSEELATAVAAGERGYTLGPERSPIVAAYTRAGCDAVWERLEADPTAGERHIVHVTSEPVAEDVVWCETCEEWVTSGAPEPATPDAGDASDAETYCGAEMGETRDGECECPKCSTTAYPDPLQDWPMPGHLKPDASERLCGPCRRGQTHLCDGNEYVRCDNASASASEPLSEDEREWLDDALWGGRIYDEVPAAVERIVAAREAKARAEAGERIAQAIEAVRSPSLTPTEIGHLEHAARIARVVTR